MTLIVNSINIKMILKCVNPLNPNLNNKSNHYDNKSKITNNKSESLNLKLIPLKLSKIPPHSSIKDNYNLNIINN